MRAGHSSPGAPAMLRATGEVRGAPEVMKINRKDLRMTWNEVLEASGVVVGDEVEIVLDVEAVPAAA